MITIKQTTSQTLDTENESTESTNQVKTSSSLFDSMMESLNEQTQDIDDNLKIQNNNQELVEDIKPQTTSMTSKVVIETTQNTVAQTIVPIKEQSQIKVQEQSDIAVANDTNDTVNKVSEDIKPPQTINVTSKVVIENAQNTVAQTIVPIKEQSQIKVQEQNDIAVANDINDTVNKVSEEIKPQTTSQTIVPIKVQSQIKTQEQNELPEDIKPQTTNTTSKVVIENAQNIIPQTIVPIKVQSQIKTQEQNDTQVVLNKPTQIDKLKFIKENKDLITENKSVESIQKVSKNLDLNLQKITKQDISTNSIPTKTPITPIVQQSNTDIAYNMMKLSKVDHMANLNQEAKVPLEPVSAEPTLQTQLKDKIFDSKIKVQSFISDIARKMVENYKPPVTALKISLNPKELGSIDIVLKSSKNTLNISFQAAPATMEILAQNQTDLRTSLAKQFSQEQTLNFSFSQNNKNKDQEAHQEIIYSKDEEAEDESMVASNIVHDSLYL